MQYNPPPTVKIFEPTQIVGMDNIQFGEYVIIDSFVFINAKKMMVIGDYVHIASHSSITGSDRFQMDAFSGLSQGVRIFTGSEDFTGWGFGNPTIDSEYRNLKFAPVHIGRFSCIGANSVILPGVTIGEGVTVGANSVVSRDLDPWGVYIGNDRVKERDRGRVMETYSRFLSASEEERIGNVFKV